MPGLQATVFQLVVLFLISAVNFCLDNEKDLTRNMVLVGASKSAANTSKCENHCNCKFTYSQICGDVI